MPTLRTLLLAGLFGHLIACSTSPPAPVIDRLPTDASSTNKTNINRPIYKTGDWRPATYTVKKGDTLFSLGLEYGYDYKEIASNNQISAPYNIKIGQVLQFKNVTDGPITNNNSTNSDEATTYPLDADGSMVEAKNTTTSTAITVLQEPKATRTPYSDAAFNAPAPEIKANKTVVPSKTTGVNITDNKPVEAKTTQPTTTEGAPNPAKAINENPENIDWSWPHSGKVMAGFNETTNKGIDIAGKTGQAINAAASGKVIYSGSDLRGYGKLVIIKHNALYLSVYAHNNVIVVKEGQWVARGQKIAEMGNSESINVKLHFEIRRQGKSVDPKQFLPAS